METISFARGVPGPDLLPVDEVAECVNAVLAHEARTALQYGPPTGFPPLRELLAERHGVEVDRIFVANGSLQGLVFLATHLLAQGSCRVLVEAPTYDRPLKILAGLGAEIEGIPMDEDGLDVDELEARLSAAPRPAFLYTIPTFQNPSGRTLSLARRRRLLELADEHDVLIVEDDPYGLVRFEGTPVPTLLELAPAGRVAYSCSFSKTVAPGLRVGYLVLPEALTSEIEKLAVSTYVSPTIFTQAIVAEFLRRSLLERNAERVSGLLRARRDAMIDALEHEFPAGTAWSRPEGGYFLWLDLPAGANAADLEQAAGQRGVTFVKGADFYAGCGGESAARLAYSFASPGQITTGVERLAAALGGIRTLEPTAPAAPV